MPFSIVESRMRLMSAIGAVLACITALPATAAPVDAGNQQIVVRDAATGALRSPTPEEVQSLQAKTVVRVRASTLPKVHTSGARGARLTDDFLSHSVLVRQADGTFAEQCFETLDAAQSALKAAPVAKINIAPTE